MYELDFFQQMFVSANDGCDAWWLVYELVCVGESMLCSWRADKFLDPLLLATFRSF